MEQHLSFQAASGAGMWMALGAALIGVVGGCARGAANLTAPAKLDSRMARDVRRADALGLAPMAAFSAGPARIGDLAWALEKGGPGEAPPGEEREASSDERWFAALRERYEIEIEDVKREETSEPPELGKPLDFFKPAEDPRLRLVFVDETVKFYNEQGRKFNEGANLYLSNRAVARFWKTILLTAEPELSIVENRTPTDTDTEVVLRFQELAARAQLGALEVTVGRTPLWWGPGRHGSLLLSNNARPFDLLKLSTAGPILLPWYFEYLGLIQAELFATRLESARDFPRPYLAGARVSSRVLPWVEVGASRTAMFGGKGRDPVTGQTIIDVVTARTENDPQGDPGDQLASIDLRLILPWSIQPVEIYGELGGDDEAGGFFSREAYLAGIYLPRIGPWHLFELTVEFANLTVDGHPRTWYMNSNFPDGYTFHEQVIGHHAGTDSIDLFAELRVHPVDDVAVFLSYDYEEHMRLDPVEERLHQFRAGIEARVWKGLWAAAFFQHDRWENFNQNRGLDEDGTAAGIGLRWEFGAWGENRGGPHSGKGGLFEEGPARVR